MANANPVNKKMPVKEVPPEFTVPEGFEGITPAELEARAKEIAASEVPASISDKQVGEVGQRDNYGKIKSAEVVPYNILGADGEVKRVGYAIRVNH